MPLSNFVELLIASRSSVFDEHGLTAACCGLFNVICLQFHAISPLSLATETGPQTISHAYHFSNMHLIVRHDESLGLELINRRIRFLASCHIKTERLRI